MAGRRSTFPTPPGPLTNTKKDGHVLRGPAVAGQPTYETRTTSDAVEVRRSPAQWHA